MTRLKLPAYGKQLLLDRRAGKHPLTVTLVYGDRWYEGKNPKICIKPEDYQPGQYDFRVVAGVQVIVIDQLVGASECDEKPRPPTFGKFYDLLSELAAADGWLYIEWPKTAGWPAIEATQLARNARWRTGDGSAEQWPRWWNDELEARQQRRRTQWLTHQAYELGILERERGQAA